MVLDRKLLISMENDCFESVKWTVPKTDNINNCSKITECGKDLSLPKFTEQLESLLIEGNSEPTDTQIENEDDLNLGNSTWLFNEVETSETKPKIIQNQSDGITNTEPEIVKQVYNLGRILSKALDEVGILYWTSGGTTLGAVRHRGLIPWDDDLDICIRDSEEKMFLAAIPVLEQTYNLKVQEANSFGYRIFHQIESNALPKDELLNYRYPFCDVFIMTKEKNKYRLKFRIGRVLWPQEFYLVKDVEMSTMMQFGDFKLRCPGNVESYLTRMYGEDWRTVGASQSYNHVTRESVQISHFQLNCDLLQPALPFY